MYTNKHNWKHSLKCQKENIHELLLNLILFSKLGELEQTFHWAGDIELYLIPTEKIWWVIKITGKHLRKKNYRKAHDNFFQLQQNSHIRPKEKLCNRMSIVTWSQWDRQQSLKDGIGNSNWNICFFILSEAECVPTCRSQHCISSSSLHALQTPCPNPDTMPYIPQTPKDQSERRVHHVTQKGLVRARRRIKWRKEMGKGWNILCRVLFFF